MYSGTSLIQTPLGQAESVLIDKGVLISEVITYTNMAFGAAKAVLFIRVSSLQGVEGFHCMCKYSNADRVPHSTQPSELRTALDSIMEERLGKRYQ